MNVRNTMNRLQQLQVAATAILILITGPGCGDHDSVSPGSNTTTAVARVYPADGSTDLSTSAKVSIAFTGPVDTMSVMGNLHLMGGTNMLAWRDSLEQCGDWGMMGTGQRNQLMDWMDSICAIGIFEWDSNRDSCTLIPSGGLDPGTDYLCVINESGMRDNQGDMISWMGQSSGDLHMFGFSTGPGATGAPKLLSVVPSDGTPNVDISSQLTVVFDMPMDTATVTNSLCLIGGDSVQMWLDSLDNQMGICSMCGQICGTGMRGVDSMMIWMDSIQFGGRFSWNNGLDTCVFVPDSELTPNTDYVVFFGGDVLCQNGVRMELEQLQYGGYIGRFTTCP
jgi:hypothetical protein